MTSAGMLRACWRCLLASGGVLGAVAQAADGAGDGTDAGIADTALASDDQEGGEPLNQTEVRERFAIIPSVYGDLRRPGVYARPALPLPDGSGTLQLGWTRSTVVWPAGSPLAAGQGAGAVSAVRDRLALTVAQSLGTPWLGVETAVVAVRDRADPQRLLPGDPAARLVLSLTHQRYLGCALVVGALAGIGEDGGEDWLEAHGDGRRDGWSGTAELRGAAACGLVALQARIGAEATPRGANTVRLPAGGSTTYSDRTEALSVGLSATWRPATWMRWGCDSELSTRRWRSRGSTADFASVRMTTAPVVLLLEVDPLPGRVLSAWGGVDLGERQRSTAQRGVLGAALAASW